MTDPDRALAALIAAFVPARAAELSAYLAPRRGAGVRTAAEALIRAGRSARLDGLARSLGPPQVVRTPTRRGGRLRERFILETEAATRASSSAPRCVSGD